MTNMNFIEELRWRGLLQDTTPGIEEYLAEGNKRAYVGFDPTAPSMTIGNLVPITLLLRFQLAGHQPVVLMGGATGRIGDPSGKKEERQLKSYELLDHNLAHQLKQMERMLRFDDSNTSAIVVNNFDFYKEMNLLTFLRDVGKRMTVNYMMSKESVKNRLEGGLSFTEFSYQLIQGYDFQHLYEEMDVRVQMGGSDQWGNITSGTELIRRNLSGKAYALTCPLLTKSDGAKFGKSEKGNIWLDPEMTSPYEFYQFWLNATDADLPKLLRTFSLKNREEIEAIEAKHAEAPHLRFGQKTLAEEMTIRIHSEEDYKGALGVSELLFNKKANKEMLLGLSEKALKSVANEISSFEVALSDFENGINITNLLAEATTILGSKSEVRRAIKGGAVAINKDKIKSHEAMIGADSLMHGQFLMIENGKKNKFMVVVK
ncbi:MAG: tyrosine--tRNA ligase [Saprospiraceae bacterium]